MTDTEHTTSGSNEEAARDLSSGPRTRETSAVPSDQKINKTRKYNYLLY